MAEGTTPHLLQRSGYSFEAVFVLRKQFVLFSLPYTLSRVRYISINSSKERDGSSWIQRIATARMRCRVCSGKLVDIIASMISAPHSLNNEAMVGDALSRLRKEVRSALSLTISKRIRLGSLENGSC